MAQSQITRGVLAFLLRDDRRFFFSAIGKKGMSPLAEECHVHSNPIYLDYFDHDARMPSPTEEDGGR